MTARTPVAQIRCRMTARDTTDWVHEQILDEIAQLTDLERGTLLAEFWDTEYFFPDYSRKHHHLLHLGLERLDRNGAFTAPLFDEAAADRALSALVKQLEAPVPKAFADGAASGAPRPIEELWRRRVGHATAMVCRQMIEEPGQTGRDALSLLLQKAEIAHLPAKWLAARFSGEIEIETKCVADLHRRAETPIAIAEINAVLKAPSLQCCALLECVHEASVQIWEWGPNPHHIRLSDVPAYRAFASTAIGYALEQVRAVHSGARPYQPDKLMSRSDASAVVRALKLHMAEDQQWDAKVFEEIWRGTAFAPNPNAKTLPSQSLTYQIAKAVIDEPRPEAVLLLAELAKNMRHAGVQKKLTKYSKQAQNALAQQPEQILDLAMQSPLDPSLSKLLKPALEGLLLRDWEMDAQLWAEQMTEKSLWPLSAKLIWLVDGVALLPKRQKGELQWESSAGAAIAFDPAQRIKLWHPIEATEAERDQWRAAIVAKGLKQPFAQAFRELYPLADAAISGQQSDLFAGHMVAQVPLIGLARRNGFTLGYQSELGLTLGGHKFVFDCGVRTFPGAGGEGQTGKLHLLGPARSFAEVPARVLNEVWRKVDLIVAVGAAGVTDREPSRHPDTFQIMWPGAQSIAMRRALVRFARPHLKIEGRWLWLTEEIRIHLGTGRMDKNGTQIDLPTKITARATPRADDKVMDQIWAAIGWIKV